MSGMGDGLGFAYAMGAILTHRGFRRVEASELRRDRRPKLMVLGRVVEECPGGIQRHYRVRVVNDTGGEWTPDNFVMGLIQMHEEELCLYADEPPAAAR